MDFEYYLGSFLAKVNLVQYIYNTIYFIHFQSFCFRFGQNKNMAKNGIVCTNVVKIKYKINMDK